MTSFSKSEIIELISQGEDEAEGLFQKAARVRNETVGNHVYFRGLIEVSNICSNDCFYCGIRRSNEKVRRYQLRAPEIIECADAVAATGITSLLFQAGERHDESFISLMCECTAEVKRKYPSLCVTLCLGELERDQYRRLFDAGAARYLLRIETSSEEHYRKLHPGEMSYKNRLRCLRDLRDLGYQVGSGVMINSPFQTLENLAEDILFLKEMDIDMCGMGPYIPHGDAPFTDVPYSAPEALFMGLKMIAVLRLAMPDINIAATTALEALSPQGREKGLRAGANVIMPQFSPQAWQADYMLYDNKPCGDDTPGELIESLAGVCRACGMVPDFNDPGHSLHFRKRIKYGNTG